MTTLVVLRHARTEWNERGLMQGRRDVPLSPAGRAEAAGWTLRDFTVDRWLSSPLLRATQTAALVAGHAIVEPALIEMHWGEWEGFTLDALRARHGEAFVANAGRGLDFRPPGGESPREVAGRIAAWIATLPRQGTMAAVTHNGVIRAMLSLATGWDMTGKPPQRLASACAHAFRVEPGGRLAVDRCNIPLVAAKPDARP